MDGDFASFQDREDMHDRVETVDSIIAGLGFDAQALRTALRLGRVPSEDRIRKMIDKTERLRIALNGCMVERSEPHGSRS